MLSMQKEKISMKQAIGYVRVSTEQQANEGVSLDAQRARIVKWCADNGYELVQVFVDAGISGKSMDTSLKSIDGSSENLPSPSTNTAAPPWRAP
jgi:predicted site-specific integrase-resolvase